MTKEKSQLKEYVEVVSVLQWVLSFLFMGKVPLSPSLVPVDGVCPTMQLSSSKMSVLMCLAVLPLVRRSRLHRPAGVPHVYVALATLHSLLHMDGDGLEDS